MDARRRGPGGGLPRDPQMMKMTTRQDEALAALSAGRSPFGDLASIEEMMHGAEIYDYGHGSARAFVALRRLDFQAGRRLDVVGLRSLAGRLDALHLHAQIEALARQQGASLLACCTVIPHIAKQCIRAGYRVTGAVLTKQLG